MFQIPRNLDDLTAEALRRYRDQAAEAYNTALSVARQNPSAVTGEQMDALEALSTFITDADGRLAPAADTTTGDQDPTGDTGGDPAGRLDALAPVTDPAPAPTTDPAPTGEPAPTAADIAGQPLITQQAARVVDAVLARTAITASAALGPIESGHQFQDLDALAAALDPRLAAYIGLRGGRSKDPLASFQLPSTEFVVNGDRRDLEVMDRLLDESRLPGGSLLAARTMAFEQAGGNLEAVTASGWCAPSEVDYSVQFNGAAAGMYDLPTMTATRGGVWIMPELAFSTVYGVAGANFFNLTEAQVIAGVTKTFVDIDCPDPTEYRLGVTGFGLVAPLLQIRAYPEYVREFTRASLIGLEHFRSALNIAAVTAASTAVNLTAVLPWSSDTSVMSILLPASEMAAVDQRYQARLAPNATIEQVFPLFVLAMMRADWMRRAGIDDPHLADAWIMSWFRARYIAPQFIYGWQDAYTDGGAGTPGDSTPITSWPAEITFLSYAPGTWVNAVADVIQLSTIYDSVRLASNERIEFFTERGNRVVQRKADSRAYTVAVCPSGGTGVAAAITCSA